MGHYEDRARHAYLNGIRASVEWLHQRAREMNDPRAAAILNTAAFHLGQGKPPFPAKYGARSPAEGRAGTPATDEPTPTPDDAGGGG